MTDPASANEIEQLKGGLSVLEILREEFSQWVDEAQDESKHETLDNVLAHVGAIEDEYKKRIRAATGG